MIKINLLPREMRKKKIDIPHISLLPIVAIFLGLVVITHLAFILAVNVKTKTLNELNAKWKELVPIKKESDDYKKKLVAMRAKIDAIDNLIDGRMSWAKKLSDLSDAMMPGVWLNKLWLEKRVKSVKSVTTKDGFAQTPSGSLVTTERTLHLSGSVIASGGEETAAIGKFIRSLEGNKGFFKDFKEIKSSSIQRSKLKESEIMNFELDCYFK